VSEPSEGRAAPAWLKALDDEDLQFVRRFVASSGSLKAMAEEYGVSYPTVRGRLDRLIAKIEAAEEPGARDEFERTLRVMMAEGVLGVGQARRLLKAHQASLKGVKQS
jgi:hypothetical protein